MPKHTKNARQHKIPVTLSELEFKEFILPYLPVRICGRPYKISRYKIFRYIMYLLYTGCQWHMIPIENDLDGNPEIHYTQIFRVYQKWVECEVFVQIFENSVVKLHQNGLLDRVWPLINVNNQRQQDPPILLV